MLSRKRGPGRISPEAPGPLRLGPFPERPGLSDLVERLHHFPGVLPAVRDVVRVEAAAEVGPGEELHEVFQGNDPIFGRGVEASPVSNVFFRPEEVHGASGKGGVLEPLPEGHGHVGHKPFRGGTEHSAVPHLDPHGFAAVEAGGVDSDCLIREEPADRQRLEGSLAEPLLLVVDCDPVLSR